MSVTTGAMRSVFSFSNHAGMLSGPHAFAGFKDASFGKHRFWKWEVGRSDMRHMKYRGLVV